MIEERSESRKKLYNKQFQNATYSLFVEDTAKYFGKKISVKELSKEQLERAQAHFERRAKECYSELLRREGEPKPNFGEKLKTRKGRCDECGGDFAGGYRGCQCP